jgi:hypothetical protein
MVILTIVLTRPLLLVSAGKWLWGDLGDVPASDWRRLAESETDRQRSGGMPKKKKIAGF